MNAPRKNYVGINNDQWGGMTFQGGIIRDAWVFGIIPESETCTGWSYDKMQELYDKVTEAWKNFGHMPSRLPPDLRDRHAQIHQKAVETARSLGWDPDDLGED